MGADSISLVSALIEAGNVDTVYRDVYLARARTLLDPALPLEEFHRIEGERAALAELPLSIGRALEKANWPVVRELSQRAESLKAAVESKGKLVEAARGVYAVADVRLDPFSPGLQPFTRIPTNDLPGLRTRAIEQLTALEQADPPWKDFYAGRRGAFQTRSRVTSAPSGTAAGAIQPEDTREAAAQALKAGDMSRLAKLADMLMAAATAPTSTTAHRATAAAGPAPEQTGGDLLVSYSRETLTQARQLGLASRHLDAWPELASLRQYAWNPLSDVSGHTEIKQVPMPAGSPEDLRGRVEMLMIHPLVNSGGARHLPKLVVEDVLGEDFPDPAEGGQPPKSQLLTTLELPGRRGLSRIVIEQSLLKRARERARPRPASLSSRLHPSGCPSSAWQSGGLGATVVLDALRRLPGKGRRTAPGARRRRRNVRRTVRPRGGRPRLRLRPLVRAVRGGASRTHGGMVSGTISIVTRATEDHS
jgi:hypothetical protein